MPSKILFILHYPPPVHGAAMVGQFIRDSKLINKQFNCRYINLGTSRSVSEIGSGGIKKGWRYLGLLLKTVQQILVFRPKLVYITPTASGAGFYKDAVVMLLAKTLGSKVVYHFHNKGVQTRESRKLDNLLYKLVFKKVHVILLAEPLYADVKTYVPENNVFYCPNGIPDIAVLPNNKSEGHIVSFLFLSNLLTTKGIYVLLDACELLIQEEQAWHLNIIGGEADLTAVALKKEIELRNLTDFVSYKGKKYGQEKEQAYAHADIFVFPTYADCFPLVLLEAMQQALPVIATSEGGIPGIIDQDNTGFIIPKRDSVALTNKMKFLIRNPENSSEMGQNGRKKYESEFTLPSFETRLASIFQNILSK